MTTTAQIRDEFNTAEDHEFYDLLPDLVPQDIDYDDPADN
jgi:hypothetical protein